MNDHFELNIKKFINDHLNKNVNVKAIVGIVLVDLNEFPSIFQKVQHSHSRHQKTTSNLLRIHLKGIFKFNEIWPLEGAMNITLW